MSGWTKEDIGNIIIYKSKSELGREIKNEKIAIYSTDSRISNTIRFVEYPIKLNSKIGIVCIYKYQRRKSEDNIKDAGDWCLIGKVSKEEMGELERIASAPKVPFNEDLNSPDTFH